MKLTRDPVERRYPIQRLRDGKWEEAGSLLATSAEEALKHMARVQNLPRERVRMAVRR
jgi:hypothetical protein